MFDYLHNDKQYTQTYVIILDLKFPTVISFYGFMKFAPGEIDSEKTNKLTFFLGILIYLFLWWLLEITGLRALIAKEFE